MTNKKAKVVDQSTGKEYSTIYEALGVGAPKQRGDEFEFNGKQVKVVEVIENGRLHVKNKNEPFDSFIVLESEIKDE